MRKTSLLRKSDVSGEKIVAAFLDKNVYSKFDDFERINDKERQVAGIDTKFTFNEREYVCDEKAAVQYINRDRPLGTFALELMFINRQGNKNKGWLIDEEKVNDSYMFVWIDKADNTILKSPDDIISLEAILVRKETIFNYLKSLGWTMENLNEKANQIYEGKCRYFGNIKENGTKFSFSEKLVEKPINILLPREKYRELADYAICYKRE